MIEHPIIFSGEMLRAIIEGRKTMTRRVIKHPEKLEGRMLLGEEAEWCPYGGPRDRLWVKETYQELQTWAEYGETLYDTIPKGSIGLNSFYEYRATNETKWEGPWKPSIFMPRKASRIMLEIDAIRVERVQDISREDIRAEGGFLQYSPYFPHKNEHRSELHSWFAWLWDSINYSRGYGWSVNPPVWVITFHRV